MNDILVSHAAQVESRAAPALPAYLRETYTWAYLRPASLAVFDHPAVVDLILWGQHDRLARTVLDELEPGQRVLQSACVYGEFSSHLAHFLGAEGRLDIIDVAPIQVENSRRKLAGFSNTRLRLADAAEPGGGGYDAVVSFLLLHEMPDDYKRLVVDALLGCIGPGGRVVFIDYHEPRWWHPLKPLMSLVFDTLEPYAKGLWRKEILQFASSPDEFVWRKETCFGGLYQKVVAQRL